MGIRLPDFAGTWYPAAKQKCAGTIEEYTRQASVPAEGCQGIGGIVPHAGWIFSGKTAFSVFNSIAKVKTPELFFIFGMHLPVNSGNYIFIDEGMKTPLDVLRINQKAAEMISQEFAFKKEDSEKYLSDNTIELQLPFIKYLFPEATIVTIGVSPGEKAVALGKKAASVTKQLGLEGCFIGSTDLTHYGPNYGFSPRGIGGDSLTWMKEVNDKRVIDLFLALDPEGVMKEASVSKNACCPGAAAAAISAVKEMGVEKGSLVEYATSYDVHPDTSFVGYAGVVY